MICNKHLYFNYHFLGNISSDYKIGDATMNSRVFVNECRYSKTVRQIYGIVKEILDEDTEQALSLSLVS